MKSTKGSSLPTGLAAFLFSVATLGGTPIAVGYGGGEGYIRRDRDNGYIRRTQSHAYMQQSGGTRGVSRGGAAVPGYFPKHRPEKSKPIEPQVGGPVTQAQVDAAEEACEAALDEIDAAMDKYGPYTKSPDFDKVWDAMRRQDRICNEYYALRDRLWEQERRAEQEQRERERQEALAQRRAREQMEEQERLRKQWERERAEQERQRQESMVERRRQREEQHSTRRREQGRDDADQGPGNDQDQRQSTSPWSRHQADAKRTEGGAERAERRDSRMERGVDRRSTEDRAIETNPPLASPPRNAESALPTRTESAHTTRGFDAHREAWLARRGAGQGALDDDGVEDDWSTESDYDGSSAPGDFGSLRPLAAEIEKMDRALTRQSEELRLREYQAAAEQRGREKAVQELQAEARRPGSTLSLNAFEGAPVLPAIPASNRATANPGKGRVGDLSGPPEAFSSRTVTPSPSALPEKGVASPPRDGGDLGGPPHREPSGFGQKPKHETMVFEEPTVIVGRPHQTMEFEQGSVIAARRPEPDISPVPRDKFNDWAGDWKVTEAVELVPGAGGFLAYEFRKALLVQMAYSGALKDPEAFLKLVDTQRTNALVGTALGFAGYAGKAGKVVEMLDNLKSVHDAASGAADVLVRRRLDLGGGVILEEREQLSSDEQARMWNRNDWVHEALHPMLGRNPVGIDWTNNPFYFNRLVDAARKEVERKKRIGDGQGD